MTERSAEARAACAHQWEYSAVVLDVAPNGIQHRICTRCGEVQANGPVASEGWRFVRIAALKPAPAGDDGG